MSLTPIHAQITEAVRELHRRWARIREAWNDETARAFEREFVEPLEFRASAACRALDQLDDLIATVRRECGDD